VHSFTFRDSLEALCILAADHLADSVTGGINEHWLSMGIEYLGIKPERAFIWYEVYGTVGEGRIRSENGPP
jgi:hypothetical protein